MRELRAVALAAAASLTMGFPSFADDQNLAPVLTPPDGIVFRPVVGLTHKGDQTAPQLRLGFIANPPDWPASLYATFNEGRGGCTAALIGPQVLLTAAHCVPPNGVVDFSYPGRSQPYKTNCTRHPQYVSNEDPSADYALCKLTEPFEEPTGFSYETVDIGPMGDLLTQPIILTGFGCQSDQVADRTIDGKYRYGFNQVVETSGSETKSKGVLYYDPGQNNNLITSVGGGANICPGDSGGPAFRRTNSQGRGVLARIIVGVNSRVFFTDVTRTTYGESLVSSTGTREFLEWADGWFEALKSENVAACGLGTLSSIPNCRS